MIIADLGIYFHSSLLLLTKTVIDERTTVSTPATTTSTPDEVLNSGPEAVAVVSIRELVAWLLVGILLVLSTVLLSLLLLHCLYKKRQLARTDVEDKDTNYEMEGNVCYEATQVKQTSGEGPHVYEAVKGGGAK